MKRKPKPTQGPVFPLLMQDDGSFSEMSPELHRIIGNSRLCPSGNEWTAKRQIRFRQAATDKAEQIVVRRILRKLADRLLPALEEAVLSGMKAK